MGGCLYSHPDLYPYRLLHLLYCQENQATEYPAMDSNTIQSVDSMVDYSAIGDQFIYESLYRLKRYNYLDQYHLSTQNTQYFYHTDCACSLLFHGKQGNRDHCDRQWNYSSLYLLFGDFVAIGNLPQKDFSILFPVFQSGIEPYYNGILSQMTGMIEIVLLVFLQHHLKLKVRLIPLFITGLILTILTLGPTIGALTEFGPDYRKPAPLPCF